MLFLAFSSKKWTFSLPDGPMLYPNTTTSTCPPFTPGLFWNAPCLLVRSRNKLGGQGAREMLLSYCLLQVVPLSSFGKFVNEASGKRPLVMCCMLTDMTRDWHAVSLGLLIPCPFIPSFSKYVLSWLSSDVTTGKEKL